MGEYAVHIYIDKYIGAAVERGTHSSPSAQWSYPIGTDWATVAQTPCFSCFLQGILVAHLYVVHRPVFVRTRCAPCASQIFGHASPLCGAVRATEGTL